MKNLLLLVLLACGIVPAWAQDMIYFRNNDIVAAKVLQVSPDKVHYHLYDYENGPAFIVDRSQLIRIEFENGTVMHFIDSIAAGKTSNLLKIGFFAPLSDYITVTYEHLVNPNNSLELTLGYIGAGYGNSMVNDYGNRKVQGVLVRGGWKFIIPTKLSRDDRDHPLHGFYFRPDVLIGVYNQKYVAYNDVQNESFNTNEDVAYASLLVTLGKQWVIKDRFCIDMYLGGGYNFSTLPNTAIWEQGIVTDFDLLNAFDDQFAITGGFRLGMLLK